MPDNPDARCRICFGNRYCVICDGAGELPIGGERCPECFGEGRCSACDGTGERQD